MHNAFISRMLSPQIEQMSWYSLSGGTFTPQPCTHSGYAMTSIGGGGARTFPGDTIVGVDTLMKFSAAEFIKNTGQTMTL